MTTITIITIGVGLFLAILLSVILKKINEEIDTVKIRISSFASDIIVLENKVFGNGPSSLSKNKLEEGPTGPSIIQGMKCPSCMNKNVSENGISHGVQMYYCGTCGCCWDENYNKPTPPSTNTPKFNMKEETICKLHAPARYHLAELFAELKYGRPAVEQLYLDELIEEMFSRDIDSQIKDLIDKCIELGIELKWSDTPVYTNSLCDPYMVIHKATSKDEFLEMLEEKVNYCKSEKEKNINPFIMYYNDRICGEKSATMILEVPDEDTNTILHVDIDISYRVENASDDTGFHTNIVDVSWCVDDACLTNRQQTVVRGYVDNHDEEINNSVYKHINAN
jgi:hypothetical protein